MWMVICAVLGLTLLSLPAAAEPISKGHAERLYANGDFKGALSAYRELGDAGDAEAQRRVGEMIFFGQGTKKDEAIALQWSLLSAEQGDRIAMYNVAYIYEGGGGVTRDYDKALYWYSKSASANYADAQYRLGEMLEASNGSLAVHWFTQAQQQGHQKAAERLRVLGGQIRAERERRREAEAADRAADQAAERAEREEMAQDRAAAEEDRQRREAESNRALEATVKQFKNTIGVIGNVPTLAPTSGHSTQAEAEKTMEQCAARCGGMPSTGAAQRKFYEHAACVCSCMGDTS